MSDESIEWKTCENEDGDGCQIPAHVSYVWPGQGRSYVCLIHATGVRNIANAIGLQLQFERYDGSFTKEG